MPFESITKNGVITINKQSSNRNEGLAIKIKKTEKSEPQFLLNNHKVVEKKNIHPRLLIINTEIFLYLTKLGNKKITSGEKYVFMILYSHLNKKTGICNPSVGTLAIQSGHSVKMVRRQLGNLERYGLITREIHRGRVKGGAGSTNNYTFNIPKHLTENCIINRNGDSYYDADNRNCSRLKSELQSPEIGTVVPTNNNITAFKNNIKATPYSPPMGDVDLWNQIKNKLLDKISDDEFDSWFEDVTACIVLEERMLRVGVPSNYRRDYIDKNYSEILLEAALEIGCEIDSVSVVLSGTLAGEEPCPSSSTDRKSRNR